VDLENINLKLDRQVVLVFWDKFINFIDCVQNCDICNNSTRCIKCKPSYYFKNNPVKNTDECVSNCGAKFYPYRDYCKLCDFRCLYCNSDTNSDCLSCDFSMEGVIQTNSNLCECGNGYFTLLEESKCQRCFDPVCTKCDTYDGNKCLECSQSEIGITYDPLLFKCICKKGMYNNQGKCEICHSFCSACTGPTNRECQPKQCSDKSYYLENAETTCLYMCSTVEDNLYIDISTKSCKKCTEPCRSCSIEPDKCLSCIGQYVLHEYKCIEKCPDHYYADNGACLPCSEKCLNCTFRDNFCLDGCAQPYFFKDNKCLESCEDGFASLNQTCVPCDNNCSSCYFDINLNQKICTKCQQSYVMHEGNCISECPYNMSPNSDNICIPCHKSCTECIGNTEFDCIKCNSDNGYIILSDQRCGFLTCTQGTFYNKKKLSCEACPKECLECESDEICITCIKGYSLNFEKKCTNPCAKLGFIQKSDSQECTGILN